MRRWNGLPRDVIESPSLEGLRGGVDMAVSDGRGAVTGLGGLDWWLDLVILKASSKVGDQRTGSSSPLRKG